MNAEMKGATEAISSCEPLEAVFRVCAFPLGLLSLSTGMFVLGQFFPFLWLNVHSRFFISITHTHTHTCTQKVSIFKESEYL